MKQVESDFDLPRLSEGGDPALSRLVTNLRAQQPDITELASLASQLAVRGIAVTPPEATPHVANAAWKKWALAGGGAASGLLLWWGLREPPPATEIVPRESPSELTPRVAGVAEPSPSAPRRGGSVAALGSAAPEEAPAAVEPETTAAPVPAPSAPTVPQGTVAAEAQNVPRVEPSARTPSSTVTNRPVVPEASDAVSAPTEFELLRDARLALTSSPVRALQLAESHVRSYPNGKLTQERELIAISALVSLGRRTAALSRASRFEQTFPQSPYRKRIGDLLQ